MLMKTFLLPVLAQEGYLFSPRLVYIKSLPSRCLALASGEDGVYYGLVTSLVLL